MRPLLKDISNIIAYKSGVSATNKLFCFTRRLKQFQKIFQLRPHLGLISMLDFIRLELLRRTPSHATEI